MNSTRKIASMRYVRPSLRRHSMLDSIAESSASSSMTTTPPLKPFAPRRATITSFGVNVPVNQRPGRRSSILEFDVANTVSVMPQRPPARTVTSGEARRLVPANSTSTPRREALVQTVEQRPRPSMMRRSSVLLMGQEGAPVWRREEQMHRLSTAAGPVTRRQPTVNEASSAALAARKPLQSPTTQCNNGGSKRRRILQNSCEVPSYARPTAASRAKAAGKALVVPLTRH